MPPKGNKNGGKGHKKPNNKPPRRRRTRRANNKGAGNYTTPLAKAQQGDKPFENDLCISGEELWYVFGPRSAAPANLPFVPGASNLARLDGMAALFDLYHLQSCEIVYKSSSAATQSGRVICAIDYDSVRAPATLDALTPIQPQFRPPVWENARLRVDPGRANKQLWLRTSNAIRGETAAFLACTANLSDVNGPGEIWCRYKLRFTNPRLPTAAFAELYRTSTKYPSGWSNTAPIGAPEVCNPRAIQGPTEDTINLAFAAVEPGRYLCEIAGAVYQGAGTGKDKKPYTQWVNEVHTLVRRQLGGSFTHRFPSVDSHMETPAGFVTAVLDIPSTFGSAFEEFVTPLWVQAIGSVTGLTMRRLFPGDQLPTIQHGRAQSTFEEMDTSSEGTSDESSQLEL